MTNKKIFTFEAGYGGDVMPIKINVYSRYYRFALKKAQTIMKKVDFLGPDTIRLLKIEETNK